MGHGRARLAAELAVHFEQGRDVGGALRYLQHAADNALRRSAHTDAIAHLTRALALLASAARDFRACPARAGPAGGPRPGAHGHQEVCGAGGGRRPMRGRTRCASRWARHAPALCRCCGGCVSCIRNGPSCRPHVVSQSNSCGCRPAPAGPCGPRPAPQYARVYPETLMGRVRRGPRPPGKKSDLRHARVRPRPERFVFDPGVDGRCGLSTTLYLLGYPDQARQRSQEALTLARALAHPYSLAAALSHAARMHRYYSEHQAACSVGRGQCGAVSRARVCPGASSGAGLAGVGPRQAGPG